MLVVDLLQNGKAALAGAVAWVLAAEVFGLEQPFLAPWAAVLVVHGTIYRTVSRSGQQVAATFLGLLLAWGCGWSLGTGGVSMGLMLALGLLLGRHRWLRAEATTIATTGIVVLATNAVFHADVLASRLGDTAMGVAVGLLVNLVVWPPLRDKAAWARTDELPNELAEAIVVMADGLRPDLEAADTLPWIRRLRRVDEGIDEAWRLLGEARESSRLNPRRSKLAGQDDQRRILHLLEQAVADSMSMARTLAVSAENATAWGEDFRSHWKRLLRDTAETVQKKDASGLHDIRAEVTRFAEELSTDSLAGSAWTEYGGLLVNLRNVLLALTEVVERGSRLGPASRRGKRSVRPRLRARRLPRGEEGYPERDEHATP